jgi:hypothetical protein
MVRMNYLRAAGISGAQNLCNDHVTDGSEDNNKGLEEASSDYELPTTNYQLPYYPIRCPIFVRFVSR